MSTSALCGRQTPMKPFARRSQLRPRKSGFFVCAMESSTSPDADTTVLGAEVHVSVIDRHGGRNIGEAQPQGYGDQIRLAGPSARPVPPAAAPEPPHPLMDPENEIAVPDDLRIRHSLLRSTREYWRIIRRSNYRWDVPLPPHFVLNVSTEAQTRVLRLLQALFTALEHRGYELLAGDRRRIQVKLLGETCELFVRERQRQVRRQPTTKGKGPSRRLRARGRSIWYTQANSNSGSRSDLGDTSCETVRGAKWRVCSTRLSRAC
jgi:hypothetical protein